MALGFADVPRYNSRNFGTARTEWQELSRPQLRITSRGTPSGVQPKMHRFDRPMSCQWSHSNEFISASSKNPNMLGFVERNGYHRTALYMRGCIFSFAFRLHLDTEAAWGIVWRLALKAFLRLFPTIPNESFLTLRRGPLSPLASRVRRERFK